MAVGFKLARSEDGITWKVLSDYWFGNSIAFGNGVFVSVGSNGRIQVSVDGVTWSIAGSPDIS